MRNSNTEIKLTNGKVRIARIVRIIFRHQDVFHVHNMLTRPLITTYRCICGSAVFQDFDAHGPVRTHEVCQKLDGACVRNCCFTRKVRNELHA